MWGSWTAFGTCSGSCGGGNQTRTRDCDNPTPIHGGSGCANEGIGTFIYVDGVVSTETELHSCNEDPCPSKKIIENVF